MARHGAGEFDRAARFYARALRLVPEEPNALNLSGVLARQQGDSPRAAALTGRALGAGDVRATRAATGLMVRWGVWGGVVLGAAVLALAPVLPVADALTPVVSLSPELPVSMFCSATLSSSGSRSTREAIAPSTLVGSQSA